MPCVFLTLACAALLTAASPNGVMIISDDPSWNDYGFMVYRVIKTPHLDRLTSESVTFTRGYVSTALVVRR